MYGRSASRICDFISTCTSINRLCLPKIDLFSVTSASFSQTISVLLLNSISLAPRIRSNLTGFIRLSSFPILPGKILTVHGMVVVVLAGGCVDVVVGCVVVVVDVDCVEVVVKGMVEVDDAMLVDVVESGMLVEVVLIDDVFIELVDGSVVVIDELVLAVVVVVEEMTDDVVDG